MKTEKLIEAVRLCGSTPKVDQCKQCAYWSGGDMSKCIPRMTTDAADVAPVRHGRWEKHPQSNEDDPVYTCSLCKLNVSGFEKRWIKYCPNCGARMNKEDEHEVSE